MKFSVCPRIIFLLLLLLGTVALAAQKPAKPSAADLHQAIKKLNVLGSVLYVAAHPDDENQRFISYCANQKLFNVTYLSLTRGDGGQNLIGPEIRDLLGVLRTEELLAARSIDGGKQWFTRANDFGFSKNPDETMRIWDKDKVLSDVVWTMRLTQPDVVVNRFYHDKKYDTHGHHTASGMLSVEAFDLAGRADAYPEQLAHTSVWQPRRTFFNTSWFFFGGQEAFEKMDKSHLFSLDVGVYLPLKGKSNNEVSAEARSMHRCQGFGNMSSRGEAKDWFDFIKGDRPKDQDLFEGINTTWTRVAGGEKIGKILARVDENYRSDNPSASLPELLKAMELIKALPDGYWKRIKLAEIRNVVKSCLGLYLEATASDPTATHGDVVKIRLEAIQRSPLAANVQVTLAGVSILPALFDTVPAAALVSNKGWVVTRAVTIPANAPFTAPYWLQSASNIGMYTVEDQRLRGQPETDRYARVRWSLTVNGTPIEYETDVAFKETEPAIGEIWRPFEVLPAAFVEFGESSYIFSENSRDVTLRVKSGKGKMSGTVRIAAPAGWSVSPASAPVEFARKGEEKTLTFRVQAPLPAEASSSAGASAKAEAKEGQLSAAVQVDGADYTLRLATIKYDHIPQQSVLMPATVHAARLDLKVKAKNVGYVMGAGDDVPNALRQMGCTVTLLETKDLEAANLAKYEAIVVGVRAYNTKDDLKFAQAALLDYAQNGGTLVAQYNTTGDLVTDRLAPFPMKLSRTRTTDEGAEMRFRLPDHAALNSPNRITSADFSGWVQERGLYFPGEWDAAFEAPLSCNDPEEKPADGSLLVAKYGKGWYVYTGLSFFRELPAGVPGAYRLFANLISMGK